MPPSQNIKKLRTIFRTYRILQKPDQSLCQHHTYLAQLLRKDATYLWTELHHRAFKELKTCLQRPPILVYPGPSKPHYFLPRSKQTILLFHGCLQLLFGRALYQYTYKSKGVDNLQKHNVHFRQVFRQKAILKHLSEQHLLYIYVCVN